MQDNYGIMSVIIKRSCNTICIEQICYDDLGESYGRSIWPRSVTDDISHHMGPLQIQEIVLSCMTGR